MAHSGEKADTHRYGALGQALMAAVLFGAAVPFSKTLLSGLPASLLAGLLYLGAALFLLPGVWRSRRQGGVLWPSDRPNVLRVLGAIVFGGVIGPVLMLLGLRFSLAASVSMWLNLETVATAVLATLFFKEHLGRWTWIGNAGVLISGVMLSFAEGWAGFLGILCLVGAGIAWGLDNNLTAAIDSITPQVSTFWKGLAAGTFNLAVGGLLTGSYPQMAWVWALALGGISYGVSITLYISSAQRLGAARSQMLFAASPFFGVLFSVLWLGEGISALQWGAGAVLTGAIGLLIFDQHGHEHHHHPMTHTHTHHHRDGHHDHTHATRDEEGRHTHVHVHAPIQHRHPHWPDLHHRHDH